MRHIYRSIDMLNPNGTPAVSICGNGTYENDPNEAPGTCPDCFGRYETAAALIEDNHTEEQDEDNGEA